MRTWVRWVIDGVTLAAASSATVFNAVAGVRTLVAVPQEPILVLLATLQLAAIAWMVVLARQAIRRLRAEWVSYRMNVRIVRGGAALRCQLIYVGVQEGCDVWAVVEPPVLEGDRLIAGRVPPMTTLVWTVSDG